MMIQPPEIGPGPPGDPEVNRRADAEVAAIIEATRHLNTPAAAAWVRANPPSAEAIARLAWKAHEWEASAKATASARVNRSPVTDRELLEDRAAFAAKNGGSVRGWLEYRTQLHEEWKRSGQIGTSPLTARAIAARLKKILK